MKPTIQYKELTIRWLNRGENSRLVVLGWWLIIWINHRVSRVLIKMMAGNGTILHLQMKLNRKYSKINQTKTKLFHLSKNTKVHYKINYFQRNKNKLKNKKQKICKINKNRKIQFRINYFLRKHKNKQKKKLNKIMKINSTKTAKMAILILNL